MPLRLLKKVARKLFGRKDAPDKAEKVEQKPAQPPHRASSPHRSEHTDGKPRHEAKPSHGRRGDRPEGRSGDKPRDSKPYNGRSHDRRPAAAAASGRSQQPDDRRRPPRREYPSHQDRERKPGERDSHEVEDCTNWSLDSFKVDPVEGKTRFHDLPLAKELMRAIAELEFAYCTEIQAQVLPHTLAGRNIAGKSQTGSGKTAAFLLSIMTRLSKDLTYKAERRGPRALILAPTRELVIQINKDAQALGRYLKLRSAAVYGGMDYGKQEREITTQQVEILAATPGRLLDFMGQQKLKLDDVEVFVIDEADRMLDMGFIPDIKRIVRALPAKEKRQTLLFSATLSDDVMRLASAWMPDPVVVEATPDSVAVDTVEQIVYIVSSKEKPVLLFNLLKDPEMKRVLVFGNRRDEIDYVSRNLMKRGIRCGILSGAVDQRKRVEVLEAFRSGKCHILIATDVAARGLHIDDITHVINYDLPYEAESYVHRIGRTARAGAKGVAISFACEEESFVIPEIEAYIGRSLPCRQPDESLLAAIKQ